MAHRGRPGVPASQRYDLGEPLPLFVGDIVASHRHTPPWLALTVCISQFLLMVTRSAQYDTLSDPLCEKNPNTYTYLTALTLWLCRGRNRS
ncbi:hypothetical protein GCM10023084_30940 [Streptomyces lacrimifluminis]|uniref:Uncharacterized protein n=1 Tax=Streptomyces lacrimifluminis TaxID=1500077 RepID=A0A917KVX7_9ACTN|nr:hypothetical protein GCM10012282_27560 [Streptomyces lacrimifluminis]